MATKTTFVCDCCFRKSDTDLGWAQITVNGASGGKQLMLGLKKDLCEICWSPVQVALNDVNEKARKRRNAASDQ
jgi:hypothetical protein